MINMDKVKNYLMDNHKTVLCDMGAPVSINCVEDKVIAIEAKSALYAPGTTEYQLAQKILEIMGEKKYFAHYLLIEEENKIRFAAL